MNKTSSHTTAPVFLLVAFFAFYSCRSTGTEAPPPQTEAVFRLGETPRFSNKDVLHVHGTIQSEYETVFCHGGLAPVQAPVKTELREGREITYFNLEIPLKLNQVNQLSIFARDKHDRNSDTLIVKIIHDNIPPHLLFSSTKKDSVSYSIDEPVELSFDSPVKDYNLVLKGENVATQELTPALSDSASTLTSPTQISARRQKRELRGTGQ